MHPKLLALARPSEAPSACTRESALVPLEPPWPPDQLTSPPFGAGIGGGGGAAGGGGGGPPVGGASVLRNPQGDGYIDKQKKLA